MKQLTLFFVLLSTLVSAQERKLQVLVDEKVELITAVQLLSGYEYLTPSHIDYKREVQTMFKSYQNHEVVKLYKTISVWFYGSAPLSFISHYDFPKTQPIAKFTAEDELTFKYSAKKDTLNLFLKLLVDFYKQSNFHSFFVSKKTFYDLVSAPVIAESKRVDYIGEMEKYFGQKQYAYKVVLSPLQMDAGFGPMLETEKGNILYAFVGPNYDSEKLPEFNTQSLYEELILHEFSHSFCNPLIDAYYSKLKHDDCLLAPILQDQKDQGYGTWKACLYEHWTRANEYMLNKTIYGQEVADALLKKHVEEEKWIYLKGLIDLLEKDYVTKRNEHPTLETLMPEVVNYFNLLAKNCH